MCCVYLLLLFVDLSSTHPPVHVAVFDSAAKVLKNKKKKLFFNGRK